MLVSLIRWFAGSRECRVPAADADRAASLLTSSGADFRRLCRTEDMLTFTLPLADCAAVERIFAKHGINLEYTREHGFAWLLRRYRRRYGIPIGLVIFFAIIFLSGRFIWTIRVVGNSSIPSELIISRLEELGCGVGTYIPSIDFDYLHNQYLIEHGDLAWIAVNLRGTDAVVEVRELELPDIVIDEDTPHNLVASEDGVIRTIDILRGDPAAEAGELVRGGQLLASGIDVTPRGFHLVHARGSVIAEVKRKIYIEVPLEAVVNEATGVEKRTQYLNIFGFSVKLFDEGVNIASEYDTIETVHPLRFFGEIEVPVSVLTVRHREYVPVTVSIGEDAAKSEAYRRLREECAALTRDCELISREVSAGMRDGAYVIECELTVLADIGKEVPIDVE